MKPVTDIIVVGTDTGVGKSVVSLLLMQLLFARGYSPFYLKPFQTGCRSALDTDSDAHFVYKHTDALQRSDPGRSVLYCFPNPKAPLYAASDAGCSIEPERVLEDIRRKRRFHTPLVVEAAGGVLVPLTEQMLVVDIIEQSGCRPLLVARAGLGTINHTLLSIEALHRRRINPLGIVLVDSPSTSASPAHVAENISAIEMFSGCCVSGVIQRIMNLDAPPPAVYHPLERILFERS